MSANFTPDELKKIAPAEYRRIYGEDKPEAPKPPDINRAKLDEARRLEAETRLLNAQRRLRLARQKERKEQEQPKPRAASPAWWVALAVAIAQFVFAWYIIAKY